MGKKPTEIRLWLTCSVDICECTTALFQKGPDIAYEETEDTVSALILWLSWEVCVLL